MVDLVTIIVVDDHPLLRQGVSDSLSLESDFRVVAQAESGEAGVELIRQLRPKIAVVDINLPGINGLQVAHQVTSEKLPTRVILLTAYDDELQRSQGAQAGAAAYCTKDIEPEVLVKVIRQVARGEALAAPGELQEPLSAREMEILTSLARGMSNKEIAAQLGISHQTVKNHVTAVLRKLGVDDRTQATLYALQRGWVRLH